MALGSGLHDDTGTWISQPTAAAAAQLERVFRPQARLPRAIAAGLAAMCVPP